MGTIYFHCTLQCHKNVFRPSKRPWSQCYSWQRVHNPLFYNDPPPPCIACPTFSNFVQPIFHYWLIFLAGWAVQHICCVILFLMILWIFKCRALIPCCVFWQQVVKFTEVWHTNGTWFFAIVFWFCSLLQINLSVKKSSPQMCRRCFLHLFIYVPLFLNERLIKSENDKVRCVVKMDIPPLPYD